jgi:outer membrane protein TolC
MNIHGRRWRKKGDSRVHLLLSVFLPILLIASCFMVVPSGFSMTLDEAVDIALQNNPDLQKQVSSQQLAGEDIADLTSQNYGRIGIVSSYTHFNLPRTLVPMTPAAMASGPEDIATTEDLFNAAFVYEVELFNGFDQTRSIEASRLQHEMATTALKLSREQLIYNVRSLYVNILALQAQQRAQDAYVDALQRLNSDVRFKFKQGQLAKIDVLKAEADLRSGEGQRDQIEANIAILKGTLTSLLGGGSIGELAEVDTSPQEPPAVDEDFSLQIEDLQRLKNARLAVKRSRKLVDKASAIYYPRIVLSSSYGLNFGPNDSSNVHDGDWEDETVWQAGINLQWNIFDFGGSHSKVKKAQIAERQSRYEQTKVELELKRSLDEAETKINSAISDYNTRRSEADLTREAEKIEQVRFDQGAADINDLLYTKARNRLAESRFIGATYNYKIACFYLDYLLEKGDN